MPKLSSRAGDDRTKRTWQVLADNEVRHGRGELVDGRRAVEESGDGRGLQAGPAADEARRGLPLPAAPRGVASRVRACARWLLLIDAAPVSALPREPAAAHAALARGADLASHPGRPVSEPYRSRG